MKGPRKRKVNLPRTIPRTIGNKRRNKQNDEPPPSSNDDKGESNDDEQGLDMNPHNEQDIYQHEEQADDEQETAHHHHPGGVVTPLSITDLHEFVAKSVRLAIGDSRSALPPSNPHQGNDRSRVDEGDVGDIATGSRALMRSTDCKITCKRAQCVKCGVCERLL